MWQLMIIKTHLYINDYDTESVDEIELGNPVSEQTLRTTARSCRENLNSQSFIQRSVSLGALGERYKNVDTGEERLLVMF